MTTVNVVEEKAAHEEQTAEGSQPDEVESVPTSGTELKQSRKREREVSLEPGTPQTSSIDIDSTHHDTKDRRTPAKKNRVSAQLDATEELEEGGENATPATQGVGCSPPHESKIRQISQGVEDLTWKNMAKHPTPEPELSKAADKHEAMETEQEGSARYAQPEQVEVPPPVHEENPPVVLDDSGVDEHAEEAGPAEVPPDAQAEEPSAADTVQDKEVAGPSTPPPRADSPIIVSPLPDTVALSRRGSNSSGEEKRLKRKLGDRTVSETVDLTGTTEGRKSSKHATATKRPRDDADADENPRLTKRPTPPPDEEKAAGPSSQSSSQASAENEPPKSGGFAAYASTSSPFATVKGPSLFASKSSPWASTSTSPFPSASSSPKPGSSSIVAPSALFNSTLSSTHSGTPARTDANLKRGFEAFASSSSPFASAAKRSKSPTPGFGHHRSKSPLQHGGRGMNANVNAFSAYATGGAHAFAKPTARRAGSAAPADGSAGIAAAADGGASGEASASQGSEDEGSRERTEEGESKGSFSARLRAQKDKEEEAEEADKKINLTEQELHTGEEDEDTVYQVRGKLYALSDGNMWKERGTGQLKLNVRREDGSGARLLMRKEAVYTVLLNVSLFKGMKCFLAQDPRYLRFSVLDGGNAIHFNLRVSNAKIAAELLEEINSHIPGE